MKDKHLEVFTSERDSTLHILRYNGDVKTHILYRDGDSIEAVRKLLEEKVNKLRKHNHASK